MRHESYFWHHKDLLDVAQLSRDDIFYIMETAESFRNINLRPVKKVPTLKGKSVILFFAENSTRTKTSFDVAGKRLSADTFALATSGSSIQKGESLKDTVLTLQAMHPDVIVMRHVDSGASKFIAERLECSVVNAGDGWHAHPTQALLDCFTLYRLWGEAFEGKNILIVGDCAHSRVCRSDVELFTKLGARVSLCAPKTLLPAGVERWNVNVFNDLDEAVKGMDVVISLRLQLERMEAGLLPSLQEYSSRYCMTPQRIQLAAPNAHVMHPGPIQRGTDVSAALADSPESLILTQVESGVAVRMAVLFILATRTDKGEASHE